MFEDIINKRKPILIKDFPMKTNGVKIWGQKTLKESELDKRKRITKKLIKHAESLGW